MPTIEQRLAYIRRQQAITILKELAATAAKAKPGCAELVALAARTEAEYMTNKAWLVTGIVIPASSEPSPPNDSPPSSAVAPAEVSLRVPSASDI
jgi:hypothetical protein